MAMESSLTKYDYIRKLDAIADLFALAIGSGAKSVAELDIPALLKVAPPYHAELVSHVYPEVIESILRPKNARAIFTHSIAVKQFLADLTRRWDEGQPVIYHFATMTAEIYLGMDLMALPYELVPLYLSACLVDGVEEELDATEAMGIPSHVCSAQKPSTSAIRTGKMPKPDIFVKGSVPCDTSNMMYQFAKELYGAEVILVDAPYYHNKRAFRYYVDEWKRMIEALEKKTGHTLSEERLRKHVEMGNRQLEYLYGLQAMRRSVPNPDPGMHRALDLAALLLSGTNDQMIEYMRTCHDEAAARHAKGQGFQPAGRKEIRTVWTWGFTPHMLYLPDWLEEEFGMSYLECGISTLPSEIVGYVDTASVESMIEGLAWRAFNFPMGRTSTGFSDLYVQDLVRVAKTYKADAAVFSGHTACKHSWAAVKMLGDVLQEDPGIPSFKWETDFLDRRFTPHSVAKKQLAEFFRTLM